MLGLSWSDELAVDDVCLFFDGASGTIHITDVEREIRLFQRADVDVKNVVGMTMGAATFWPAIRWPFEVLMARATMPIHDVGGDDFDGYGFLNMSRNKDMSAAGCLGLDGLGGHGGGSGLGLGAGFSGAGR